MSTYNDIIGPKLYLKLWFVGEVTRRSCMLLKSFVLGAATLGLACKLHKQKSIQFYDKRAK